MRQARLHAPAALGLCLAMPLASFAQVADGAGDAMMFTAPVRACLAAPTGADCADQGQVLIQCAVDLDYTLCAPLFDAPAMVFQDPARMLAAQSMLTEVSTALAARDGTADNGTAPDLVVEAAPEDFRTPPDPEWQPDPAQARALEQLMADPAVSEAVARFETHHPQAGDETDYPQALHALQRAQRGEETTDEAALPVELIEGVVAAADLRRSRDEFADRPVLDFDAGQAGGDGGSELDRAGLVSLARLAVGMQVDGGRIIARADERVVMGRTDADPVLWRDDDAILRVAELPRWIEVYGDGSTLTRWQRADGSWTISIRDVTGRALWRERILVDRTSVPVINDLDKGEDIDLSALPDAAWRELRVSGRTDLVLTMALLHESEADSRALGRSFTLSQVRDTRRLRDLMPVLGPVAIGFGANGASINASEAANLGPVGRLIEQMITDNPRELFLIEGHTDGTGPAAYNLALSDRRAESVALALTENFSIPPENLVVQGYGERHLRIPTAEAEAGNRRVAIRRITPLLWQ